LTEIEKVEPKPFTGFDSGYFEELVKNKSQFPFTPRSSTTYSSSTTYIGEPRLGLLVPAFIVFLIPFTLFERELPTGASFPIRVSSRLIILLIDICAVSPLASAILKVRENIDLVTKSNLPSSNLGGSWQDLLPKEWTYLYTALIPVFIYGLSELHGKLIGPLTFRTQVLQFLLNLPAIMLAIAAFYLRK
jgi:hypothetical protein